MKWCIFFRMKVPAGSEIEEQELRKSPLHRTLFVRARTNPDVGALDGSKGYYTRRL
jgi:hypothetical protein